MPLLKELGIFLETNDITPEAGDTPQPWRDGDVHRLRWAFICDLAAGAEKLKRTSTRLFLPDRFIPPGGDPARAASSPVERSSGGPAERLNQAFDQLLTAENCGAVVISAACPDLPVQFIKRAFLKLKHHDIVLGPATGGGWYLLGLKRKVPELLHALPSPDPVRIEDLLERARKLELNTALLFPWYRSETVESLQFLNTMIRGSRAERGRRFKCTEPVLSELIQKLHSG